MPNPRAQRPLSLQAVTEDIRSLAQPAEALLDMLAGAAKGSVTATAGIGGDLESLARGLAAAYRAPSGQRMDAFAGGLEQPTVLPTTQKISDMLPAVLPATAPLSRQHSAEYGQTAGEFIPTPGSGRVVKGGLNAIKSIPAALQHGAQEFAKASAMGVPHVIKPKGGNWLTGDVEPKVGKMKMSDKMTPEWYADRERWLKEAEEKGNQRQVRAIKEDVDVGKRNDAINDWIDRNLTNYIKKEMATPEDPVRKLAEQGITHKSDLADFRASASTPVQRKREQAGFPIEGMGQSDLAKQWENLADYSFSSRPAMAVSAERFPWVAKLDPNTPVYGGFHALANRELGFDHIVDVLRQDVREGRIRPEQLSKVSMEQAVRRTYEYDQEMAKKMREAAIKQTEGMPVHKEYPEGYKWIELKPNKNLEGVDDGFGNISSPGYEGLEQALKYEGDTMGHCVGGYCPDVYEGRSRIFSLRDAKGEPHVTVEVNPRPIKTWDDVTAAVGKDEAAKLYDEFDRIGGYNTDNTDAAFDMFIKQKGIQAPDSIAQIKGKQNRAPKEEYLPFVQDFVRGGQWSDVRDLQNTGLRDMNRYEPLRKYLEGKGTKFERYIPEEEFKGHEDDFLMDRLYPKDDPDYAPPTEGMKRGGKVHISDNLDAMQLELGERKFGIGGTILAGSKAGAKAGAKTVKPNIVIKSEPGIVVSNLIDEEPNLAKRMGAQERAKRQAALEAEGKRQQLAAQTQPTVGYRKSTEKSPDPLVGTRFVNDPAFGLKPNDPFDISKFKGANALVLPWDSQSRNVRTTQVSGMDLPNQIFRSTHGGVPYSFDLEHINRGVAGASGLEIAKRVQNRSNIASQESIRRGGTGEVLHMPITMGFRGEDYALPYSEFSFEVINHKLATGELTREQADQLSNMIRNYTPPEAKYRGKKPFADFKGFTDPEGLDQIYTGQGLKAPPGDLRKAIADRMIWQKGSQEMLGFNAEDLMNATTYEPLRGVGKGVIGSSVIRNTPTGMKLSPSLGRYPYDTDFSGEHLGRLDDLVDVEALFYRTLNPIKRELMERENKIPYTKDSLRNAAIGAIEKRNESVSQPIDQQFLDDYIDYVNELRKPHEYRSGGAIKKAAGGEITADDLILEERKL